MVKLVAVALVLAGCLSKPAAPVDGGAGSDTMADAMSDAPIDAPPACVSPAAPFPLDFAPERLARIIDLDHNGADDLVVYGHTGITVRVYIVLGRSPMVLDCYDFEIALSVMADILDVWVGDVTGDGFADLAVLARGGGQYIVELYPGRDTGGFMPRLVATIPQNMFGLSSAIGGTPGDRAPAFVTGFRNSTEAGLIFGGIGQPFAVAPLVGGALSSIVQAGDIPDGALFGDLDPTEQVWTHSFGSSNRKDLLVATTDQNLRILRHGVTNNVARFDNPSAPININVGIDGNNGSDRNRTVRVWHRPFASDATMAVMEGAGTTNIAIVNYRTFVEPDTNGFESVHIVNPLYTSGGYTEVRDFAIGTLDGAQTEPPDVIALTSLGPTRRLTIARNLDFTTNPSGETGGIGFESPALTTTNILAGNTLAVGDFDGDNSTPDQILVIARPDGTSTTIGACYQVIHPQTTPCIARCGESTCL